MRLLDGPTDPLDAATKDYVDTAALSRVSVETGAFTAVPGTLHELDFSFGLGDVNILLPPAPPQGTKVAFSRIDSNALTSTGLIAASPGDTLVGESPYDVPYIGGLMVMYIGTFWLVLSRSILGLSGVIGATNVVGNPLPTVMLRDSDDRTEVADPVSAKQAANKEYSDAKQAARTVGTTITTTASVLAGEFRVITFVASLGTITISLPTAPPNGTVCKFVRTDGNAYTSFAHITPTGSDVLSTGSSAYNMTFVNAICSFTYVAGTWYPEASVSNMESLTGFSASGAFPPSGVIRNSSGQYDAGTPTAGTNAANKAYVDIGLALLMQYDGLFNNTSAYAANDVVIYNNMPYVCTTAVPAPVASSIVGSATFSSSTLAAQNVTLPVGCLAGDAVYLAWAQDSATVPTAPITGATRQGAVLPGNNSVFGFEWTYTLTSTDITNGYVALVAQANGTVYAGVMWVARACTTSISAANFYTTNLITNATGVPSGYPVFTVHATASLTTGTAVITQASLTGLVNVNAASGTHSIAIGSGYETLASGTPPARTFAWTNRSTGGGGLTMTLFFVEGGGGTNSNPDVDPTHWTLLASEYPGVIKMHGSVTPPAGYLLCDGSAISRTTYATLFSVIGTGYGTGNGSTTFNIPDFGSSFPQGNTPGTSGGSATHTHTSAAHTHTSAAHTHTSAAHTHGLGAGYAQITMTGGLTLALRQSSAAWTANVQLTGGATSTAGNGSTSTSLGGTTDSTTPGATGSTTPGATGSTTPAATGSTSTLPPFIGVAFIIKT